MSSTKLLEESLIWFDYRLSKCPGRGKARHFQLFFKLFSSHFPPRIKTILGVLLLRPSLECLRRKYLGKVEPDLECLRRRLLEEPLIWFDYTSRQRQSFIFHFLKIFNHAGFRPKYKTASRKSRRIFREDNFSSSLLPRSKIVKVSLVDGLLGCS